MSEVWKDVHGFNGYQINDKGIIRSFFYCRGMEGKPKTAITPKIMKPRWCGAKKYFIATLWREKRAYTFLVHRLLHETFVCVIPEGHQIDHIDRNTLNNSLNNLRLATRTQNNINSIKHTNAKASKYKGVFFRKRDNTWGVRLQNKHVGIYKTEVEAAKAYNQSVLQKFGEFANLNILPEDLN